jgi:hypothetical protein
MDELGGSECIFPSQTFDEYKVPIPNNPIIMAVASRFKRSHSLKQRWM